MDQRIIMKKYSKLNYFLFAFCLYTIPILAQGSGTGFDDDVVDNAPVAPINNYIPILFITAIAFGFLVFRKKINNQSTN
jgi:hypothetical protein